MPDNHARRMLIREWWNGAPGDTPTESLINAARG